MPSLQYKENYPDLLIKHMSQGLSFSTFGATVGVARQTCYEWVDKYPEFKEAKSIGEQKAQDFMEKRLLIKLSGQNVKGIDTKKIDSRLLEFALKTRFYKDYGDKSKHQNDVSGTININIDKDDVDL